MSKHSIVSRPADPIWISFIGESHWTVAIWPTTGGRGSGRVRIIANGAAPLAQEAGDAARALALAYGVSAYDAASIAFRAEAQALDVITACDAVLELTS